MAGTKTGSRKLNRAGHDHEDSSRDRPKAQLVTAAKRDPGDKNENHEHREVNRDWGPRSGKEILSGCDTQIEAKAQTEVGGPQVGTKTASVAVAESEDQKIFSANTEAAARINQTWLTAWIDGDSDAPNKNWTRKTKENTRATGMNHE
jgi:hypothetical protein